MRLTDTLYQLALEFIDNRIKTIRQAIAETQDSADQESKSSAGDKYETGLSMMQLDMEKQAEQLNETIRTRDSLQQLKAFEDLMATASVPVMLSKHRRGIFTSRSARVSSK